MPAYVAFLRAINVGGRTVTMARLRAVFEATACTSVETFIASGNVIFHTRSTNAAATETRLEKALRAALGYEVATFLRTPSEVVSIARNDPFDGEESSKEEHSLFVTMLASPPTEESRRKLMSKASALDAFAVVGREMYWLRRSRETGFSGAQLERIFGQKATARNINTVRAIAARLSPA